MKHGKNNNMHCTDRRATHIHMKIIYQICINLKNNPRYLPVEHRYQNKLEIPYTCRKFDIDIRLLIIIVTQHRREMEAKYRKIIKNKV